MGGPDAVRIEKSAVELCVVALLMFSLVIGNKLIAADHPDLSRDDVVARATRLLLG